MVTFENGLLLPRFATALDKCADGALAFIQPNQLAVLHLDHPVHQLAHAQVVDSTRQGLADLAEIHAPAHVAGFPDGVAANRAGTANGQLAAAGAISARLAEQILFGVPPTLRRHVRQGRLDGLVQLFHFCT